MAKPNVKILGWTSDEKLKSLMQNAKVLSFLLLKILE